MTTIKTAVEMLQKERDYVADAKATLEHKQKRLESSQLYKEMQKAKEDLALAKANEDVARSALDGAILSKYNETGKKTIVKGLGVRVGKKYTFKPEAIDALVAMNRLDALKVDATAAKKIADSYEELPAWVSVTEKITTSVATDLSKVIKELD